MLTQRQKQIMIAIVEAYTENPNVEPVGSHTLSKIDGLDVSTATLRNEMAALEEEGYLEKPHTSAGRIPTQKGYRLYVDELLENAKLESEVAEQVQAYFESTKLNKIEACDELLKTLVDSYDFSYGAIRLEKVAYNDRLKKISFIYLKDREGIFVLVTDNGSVMSRKVAVNEFYNIKDIENVTDYLSETFANILLNDFKNLKKFEFNNDGFFDYIIGADKILEFVLVNIRKIVEDKHVLIGQYNILRNVDFNDIELAQEYLEALKDGSIYSLVEFDSGPIPVLSSGEASGITIKVGEENSVPSMRNCSSITGYFQGASGVGAITIYGPMRMKYRYVIAFIKAILEIL